jgi:hypothetical protein
MLRVLLVFLLPVFFQSIDYRNVFSDDYDKALLFITKNTDLFLDYSSSYQTDPEIIIPVLFPEAIRYSIISDFLETKSLELAYVYSGSADFSIGFFQMKPSFIENLEKTIGKYPEKLAKYNSLLIPFNSSLSEIRKERIKRLEKLDYQIAYANCLYDILKIIYPQVFNYDKAFQIKFISTAFNHGFLTGQKEILEFAEKAFFPFSGKNNSGKYVYNEISLYFYENDLPGIVSKKK